MASKSLSFLLVALVVISQVAQVAKTDAQERVAKRQTDLQNYPNNKLQQQSNRFTSTLNLPQVSPQTLGHQNGRGSIVLQANNEAQATNYNYLNLQPAQYVQTTSQTPSIGVAETTARSTMKPVKSDIYQDLNYMRASNLDQAMRHAIGDETLFQPSPMLDIPGHSLQWSPPSVGQTSDKAVQEHQHPIEKHYEYVSPTTSPPKTVSSTTTSATTTTTPAPATTTTTDQSNSILQLDSTLANAVNHFAHQKEYPATLIANGSSSLADLNNQVVYEGPATAPPSTPSDYYFSSSEKLPNNEGKAPNVWWAIGIGQEFEKATNLTKDDYLDYCAKSELLVGNKQRSLCRMHPRVMPVVARGLKMAIDECQGRFSSSRWNCSLVLQNSLGASGGGGGGDGIQVFGDFMRHSIRERSYLNAITSAAIAHAMTKACSQGELPEECSCDKRIRSKSSRGKVEWTACSDDIDYGARFSRDWTDNTSNESDTTGMINTHNNEVGRRVFKSATDITCTCQGGENGLCQTKKCWRHLSPFAEIGDELLRRYESATHVQLSNRDPHKLRPVRRGVRKPKRKDLVFIDESPDYCSQDNRLGVLGTQNRHCNSTSSGPDSCSLLCCGRGYQVFVDEVEEDCNCKFVWCCQVKCDKCRRQVTSDICN